jgi:hypothetical protein
VEQTAANQNTTYNREAQGNFADANNDINSYQNAVGAFKAANPYTQGGQAQTLVNQQLSDTAAGGAQALGQTVQGAAARTGQNAGGAIAAGENVAEQNQRTLAGEEAGATEKRLGLDTGYQEAGLEGTANVANMRDKLASQQGELAQGDLGIQEKSSETPGFGDVLGDAFGQSLGKAAGTAASGALFGMI